MVRSLCPPKKTIATLKALNLNNNSKNLQASLRLLKRRNSHQHNLYLLHHSQPRRWHLLVHCHLAQIMLLMSLSRRRVLCNLKGVRKKNIMMKRTMVESPLIPKFAGLSSLRKRRNSKKSLQEPLFTIQSPIYLRLLRNNCMLFYQSTSITI